MHKLRRIAIVALAAVTLGGCGVLFPGPRLRATRDTPSFKAGYADGCAAAAAAAAGDTTGEVRNENAFRTDRNYRAGWANGMASCRGVDSPSPGQSPVPDTNPGGGNGRQY